MAEAGTQDAAPRGSNAHYASVNEFDGTSGQMASLLGRTFPKRNRGKSG